MIKLSIRDPSDCIEFPVYPIMPEKNQEIRGHVAFPPKKSGIEHDKNYVMDKISQLAELGIKEITVHTMGLTPESLDAIATFVRGYGATLNIENRKAGRTKTGDGLERILWATRADLSFDVGHTEANGNTDEYIRRFGEYIRNAHLYKIETTGHQPFETYCEFGVAINKLLVLPNLEWIVIEANQVDQIVEWYKRRIAILNEIQEDAIEGAEFFAVNPESPDLPTKED